MDRYGAFRWCRAGVAGSAPLVGERSARIEKLEAHDSLQALQPKPGAAAGGKLRRRTMEAGGGSGGGGATFHAGFLPVHGPRSGATRVIRGRVHEVTPGQEARLDVSAAQARAAIREVQRHDPTWRPRPSIYEGVEGEIAANQSDALQAAARLRELGARELAPKPPETTLIPNGQVIGRRQGRADGDTRTVTSSEFDEMLEAISPGAEMIRSPSAYNGHWYRRFDGFIFGIRKSPSNGITFDVIDYDHPIVNRGFKVHQR